MAALIAALMPALPALAAGTESAVEPLAAAVCVLHCDTRDPSLARQDTFPVGE